MCRNCDHAPGPPGGDPAPQRPLHRLSPAAWAALGVIWIYRHSLSLVLGRGCRYAPTCSDYTGQAIVRFGFWAGGWVGLSRILRCNPYGASGYDPVPDGLPADARWYLPWRYGRWTGAHIPPEQRWQ